MLSKLRPVGSRVPLPRLEEEFRVPWEADYLTQFMGSGTEALSAAVAFAVGRKAGVQAPEVLIPAYGCPDLVAAVVAQGCRPVLVDLEASTSFMDHDRILAALSDRTVAVVAVGFLGIPERLAQLSNLCRHNGVLLIEDSAQCFPPACAGNPLADIAVLSFGRGKPINLMGGGALLIRHDHSHEARPLLQAWLLRKLRVDFRWRIKRLMFNFLMARFPYFVLERLPFLGIGQTRLHRLQAIHRLDVPEALFAAGVNRFFSLERPQSRYVSALKPMRAFGWESLCDIADPAVSQDDPILLRFPLLAPDPAIRDKALEALNAAGIGASAFYGRALREIDGVSALAGDGEDPCARDFAARLLTLPAHEDVTSADIKCVADVLFIVSGQAPRVTG